MSAPSRCTFEHFGERIEMIPWVRASAQQRAAALPASAAAALMQHTMFRQRAFACARSAVIDIANELGLSATGQPLFMVESEDLLEGLRRAAARGSLLLAREHILTPEPAPTRAQVDVSADWSGDSAKWPEDKKLASMNPDMARKVKLVLAGLRQRGFQAKIHYGWRSVDAQAKLKATGKSTLKFSFHNATRADGTPNSYAADIIDSRYAWGPEAKANGFWAALGDEAKKQNLIWGGDWVTFKDVAHIQLVPNTTLARIKRESGR